jgi:hypothetical protein
VLNHGKADTAGMAGWVVNALGSLLIISWLSQKNIGNKLLRVSIVQGEPGGLDLDHQMMTAEKDVIRGRKSKLVGECNVRLQGLDPVVHEYEPLLRAWKRGLFCEWTQVQLFHCA